MPPDEVERKSSITAASVVELERRVAERTADLEAERARLSAVVEHVPVGMIIVAADGKVLVRNRAALRILNVAESDLADVTGFAAWRRWRPDGTPYGADDWPLARSLRTGEVVDKERLEIARPDGAHVVLDVSAAPVRDAAGRIIGSVGIFADVTIQDRQDRLEREFVTNAAHELQSPLAAIVSAVEVLQAGAKDTPARDLFLGHIERETDRLVRLARALLVLVRAQAGVEGPKNELVAVEPLLRDVASALRPADGVEIAVDCPPELALVTNRDLLAHAIANLGENAAKHTVRGRITLRGRRLDGSGEISIIDTGPGIPAAERPRVFERFYRADRGETPGFGIGLAIVRSVAEALGAEIELDSTVGAGTIVRLRVPSSAELVA